MFFRAKKILIFSRLTDKNYGDRIIGDCCKYLIEKTARRMHVKVQVSMANVLSNDQKKLQEKMDGNDVYVFPGGGMNSVRVNRKILQILDYIERQPGASVCFNAIGILRVNPSEKNEAILENMFNRPQVKQITTRGDYEQLKKYITTKKSYETQLVFDPAVWVNEAYQIERKPDSNIIGVGVIRPEKFEIQGVPMNRQQVMDMYAGMIQELEKRGYEWKLFTNGIDPDYEFGIELLDYLHRPGEVYLGENIASPKELVTNIAGFKAVIAARLHANIIATSLGIPSVGLVWNDKMNLFADIIGCKERYISSPEYLLNASYMVDLMESAIVDGYDFKKIEDMKRKTIATIKNIVKVARKSGGRS